MTTPDVSLVFETDNNWEHRRIRLVDVVDMWKRQTAAARILEWLVVATRPICPEEERALADLPYRWIVQPDAAYYAQKNAGIAQSRGMYLALVDSDERPEPDWLDQALAAMEAAPAEVAVIAGRTGYDHGPFSMEMTVAHFPFQHPNASDVLYVGGGSSLFRGDVLRRFLFEGEHIRHGADVDLALRLRQAGYRVVYDPSAKMTHNYTDHLGDLWAHVVMKGHAFALYSEFRGRRRRHPVIDAVGRFRALIRRLGELRRSLEVPFLRLPLSAVFFAWYVVAAGHGYALGLRGKPVPSSRF
jgi:glycosyltransferase involved in cell wall biosynthesis